MTIYIGSDVDLELIRFACVTRQSKLLVLACVVDRPPEEMAPIVQKITEALLPISTVVLGGSPPSLNGWKKPAFELWRL